jgi:hypothetical protein
MLKINLIFSTGVITPLFKFAFAGGNDGSSF